MTIVLYEHDCMIFWKKLCERFLDLKPGWHATKN